MGFAKLIVRDNYGNSGYHDRNYNNKDAADKLIRYVFKAHKGSKSKAVRFYGGLGVDLITSEKAVKQMKKIKKLYKKLDRRQMYHFILSFDSRIENPIEVYEVGRNIIDAFFYGYQIIFTVHEDTDNLHIHFILNSVNMLTGYKWHMNGAEFKEFKSNIEDYVDAYFKKAGDDTMLLDYKSVAIEDLI